MNKYLYNIDFLNNQSRDLGYFLGFLISDGYSKNRYIKFQLNPKDSSILEYFTNLICPNKKLVYHNKLSKNKLYNVVDLDINCKQMVNIIKNKFNIESPKTNNLKLPTGLDPKFYPDLIRGFFDGDGSVSILRSKLRSRICCISKKFLYTLKELLKIGKIVKSNNMFELSFNEPESLRFRDIIYNNEPFALSRKKDIFYSINRTLEQNYNNVITRRNVRTFTDNEINIIQLNFNKKDYLKSINYLCNSLNRSFSSIHNKIIRLGL